MIIGMLQIGVAMGVQPIISYSYGAKNWKRMRETIQKTAIATILLGLTLTLLCRGFASTLVTAFLDDAAIIPLGVYVISIGTLSGPFIGLYQLCTTFYNQPKTILCPLCIRFTSGSNLYPGTLSPGSHCRIPRHRMGTADRNFCSAGARHRLCSASL